MEYIDIFAELIAAFVDVCVVYTFFLGVFGFKNAEKMDGEDKGSNFFEWGQKSCQVKAVKAAAASIFIILPVVLTVFIHSTIKMNLAISVGALLFSTVLLDGNQKTKLWIAIETFVVMTLVDYFNVFFFAGLFGESWKIFVTPATPIRNATILMSRFCMLPLVIIAFRLIRGKMKVVRGLWLNVSLCAAGYLGSLIAMHVAFKNALSDIGECEMVTIIVIMLTFCVANGAVVVLLNRYFAFKCENDILNVKISDQLYMLKRIDDIYEETRIIRHDTKHYLALISSLLDMGDEEEANRVVKTALEKKMSSGGLAVYTSSSMINAILNEKYRCCSAENIILDISVTGNIASEYEFDASVVLANLLDNAIEAEQRCGGDRVYVNLSKYKGMYYITVQNHIAKSILNENPFLETTKTDKKYHGLGIKSVRRQVEKMDGWYQCFEENGRFVTSIALPQM